MDTKLINSRIAELDKTLASKERRLADLEQEVLQTKADINAIGGAMQDCHFWLKTLQERDATAKTEENNA